MTRENKGNKSSLDSESLRSNEDSSVLTSSRKDFERGLDRPPASRKFGVVIVHYDKPQETFELLQSISSWEERPLKVVLADNSAPRHSWKAAMELSLPLQVLEFPDNPGYGAAVNRSVEAFDEAVDFLLVLTHEVRIGGDVVTGLLNSFLEEPKVAISGPSLAFKSQPGLYWSRGGRLGPRGQTSHIGIKHPIVSDQENRDRRQSVDWVDGSCFLTRLDLFKALGGFDEDFFLYVEEVELCLRARLLGGRILVDESLLAYQEPGNFQSFLKFRNHILLTRKHSESLRPWPWIRTLIWDVLRWSFRRHAFQFDQAIRGVLSVRVR